MVRRDVNSLFRRLGFVVSLALIGASTLGVTGVGAAGGHDRFKASATDDSGGGEAGELRDALDFEQDASEHPVTGTQTLVSRCRFEPFAGDTSFYSALSASEHDVIVADTAFGFADGTSCWNPQNEQNIVVNPTNANNIVTSANDYRADFGYCYAYVTTDRGSHWTNVVLPGWTSISASKGVFTKTGCGGDPVLAFAPNGTLYFASLTYNLDKFPRQMSGVAVSSSGDGGLHWSTPVMVDYNATGNFFQDKEWIGVGNDGSVYLTWTRFYQGPKGLGYIKSPIVMASSRNGGKSWSSVKEVSDAAHPYNQGSQVGQAPDGALYVAYEGSTPGSSYNNDALVVARSTNGGTSFTNTEVARVYDDLDCYPLQIGAQERQTLSYEQFRINGFPSMAIDPTNGTIAIVWADNQGSGTCGQGGTTFVGTTSNQVKLVTSTSGTTWSAVRKITSTAPDKVYPSVGANAGTISIAFYTREYSPAPTATDRSCGIEERDSVTGDLVAPTDPARAAAPVCLDWAVRTSTDDFASQVRVTSQSSNPYILFSGSFIGDYTGTAVDSSGRTVTVWTDFRGNPGITAPNQDTYVGVLPTP